MKLDFHAAVSSGVDLTALAADLRRRIQGEVRFDSGSRALYSYDGSNYRQVPMGVVVPRDAEDVIEAVAACRAHGAPLLGRGGGTSLAGQCCNVAVVLDFSKYMNEIIEVNPDERYAIVEPGVICDQLRDAAEEHGLTWAPDPSTHAYCTLGGMIGNNSCGVHSVMGGKTEENVIALEILTYDGERMWVGQTSDDEIKAIIASAGRRGEIYAGLRSLRDQSADLIRERYPDIPRRVSGYNLDRLLPENGFDVAKALVGTESTCVTVLQAKVRLVESPPARTLLVLGFPSVYDAADHVPDVMKHDPIGLEGLDDRLIEDMKLKNIHPDDIELVPEGRGWLLAEFGGATIEEADAKAHAVMESFAGDDGPTMKLFDDTSEEKKLWEVRESGLGATARVPGEPDTWEGWEDSAVPPERMGDYLRDLRDLLDGHGYDGAFYGHFGQGCLHTRIDFDLRSEEGVRNFRSFIENAADLVVSYGGSLSGEHGDGQSRAELLPKMFGEELVRVFGEFKRIWDPDGKMNPHKVVDPYRLDDNLRLGADYDPWDPPTKFSYAEDDGSFNRAALRCVGVGKCRRPDEGTMCPSFMVTREEKHSTRGRARLLFEMMEGEVVADGWRSDEVKEALDLCLACKGCKGECPMNVDMATYKAEFMSHHYRGRLRPRAAYALGLIFLWSRLSSHTPRLANLALQTPVVSNVMKGIAGIAQQRSAPPFATETFRAWFDSRPARRSAGEEVVLWADTFNAYMHVEVAKAAVEVLEHLGFSVSLSEERLCCGRPLYDYGMLDTAKKMARAAVDALRDDVEAGRTIVGLEPSCTAVFRDELPMLLPDDEDAQRVSMSFMTLSEFLIARDADVPSLEGDALLHPHCHQNAVMGITAERQLLERMGLSVELSEAGCCGLAGSFGFEAGEKHKLSVEVGERKLLPKVRSARPDTFIVADGFSCKTQIEHLTPRRALHTAQVIKLALDSRGFIGPSPPEALSPDVVRTPYPVPRLLSLTLATIGVAVLARYRH